MINRGSLKAPTAFWDPQDRHEDDLKGGGKNPELGKIPPPEKRVCLLDTPASDPRMTLRLTYRKWPEGKSGSPMWPLPKIPNRENR